MTNCTTKPQRRRGLPDGYRTIAELAADGPLARSSLYRHAQLGALRTHEWLGRRVVSDRDFQNFLAVTPLTIATDAAEAEEHRP